MTSYKSLHFSVDSYIGRLVITVREVRPDPYEGLKGQAYIEARKLNNPVQRLQTSAQQMLTDQLEAK